MRDKAEVEKAKKPQALKGDVGPAGRGASLGSADGKYRMRLGVRIQPGFTALGLERDEDISTYNVRRVKIYADGYLGRRETEYRYQVEAAGVGARLDDAYIQENFAHDLKVRVGQYKLPASRSARRLRLSGGSTESFRQWTRPEAVRLDPVGSDGWYYQVGFLVIPKVLEVAWRDSAVDPDRARGADRPRETGVGVNYYLQGHAQKVYADVLHLSDASDPRTEHTRSRVQYQLTF